MPVFYKPMISISLFLNCHKIVLLNYLKFNNFSFIRRIIKDKFVEKLIVMKKVRVSAMILMLSAGMFAFTSCGGGETTADEQTTTESTGAEEDANAVTIEIEGNDKMQFNLSEITVKAGQEVTLVLKHVGTMPVTAMGHNFVLLKQGVDVNAFSKDAISAKDHEYIPEGTEDVIAHTKLIGGGESDTVVFTAPEAGSYDFICSFPGHHSMMKGKFIVE